MLKGIMKKEQGFSAVEALIATAITIFILAGTMDSFNRSLGINEKANQLSDVEQNMRAGMNLMVSDFISAGWSIPIGGIPIPSGAGAISVRRPGPPEKDLKFLTTSIASVNTGQGLGPDWNGEPTDIVNILCADNMLLLNEKDLVAVNDNGASVVVDPSIPISGTGVINPVTAGDLILLSNANGSTLQYVTEVNSQTISFGANDPMRLNQPGAAEGSVTQLRNVDEDGNPLGFPGTSATRVWLVTYYLDFDTVPNTPRLMRRINFRDGAAVALVLENLQLSYDSVDGDANPSNDPINEKTPADPSQIRKATIMLSGRSSVPVRDTGEFFRRSLTTQVSLRSLSYFDRY
jgi:type II secretory pathway pseudopilin PulG